MGIEPQNSHSQSLQMIQSTERPKGNTYSIPIAICKRADENLINDRLVQQTRSVVSFASADGISAKWKLRTT